MTTDTDSSHTPSPRRWYAKPMLISVVGIVLTALALRVIGVGWSLPYVDHPDEPAIVGVMLRMVQGDLNPKHFFYPTLIMYLQALVFKGHFWWGTLTGMYGDSFTLPNSVHFYTSIPQAFVWSRTITALLGTTTVLALATWSRRFIGKREGLLAAALLAWSAWAIIHDHYITVDGPSALFGLLALLAAFQILHNGTWREYLLAGLLIGLAAGTKYQNVLVAASVTLAHGLRWRGDMLHMSGRLVAAGGVSAVVFLMTTPYIILAPGDFMHDIRTLFESYGSAEIAHGDVTGAYPVWAYLRFYWRECLEPIPFILALLGGGVLIRRQPAVASVLLLFPLLMILSLLRPFTHFYRNLLPTLPVLLMLAGVGGVVLLDWLTAIIRQRYPQLSQVHVRLVWGIGLVLLLSPSLLHAVQASKRFAQPDSRVIAQTYIHDNWQGVRVASELSHPLRWNGVAQATYVHYLPRYSLDWYREHGFGLLLANDGKRDTEELTKDYAPLLAAGEVVGSFGGRDSGMLGPRIDIVDVQLTPDTVPIDGPQVQVGYLRLLGAKVGYIVKQGSERRMEMQRTIEPGRTLALLLFWTADKRMPPDNLSLFVHLRDAQGRNLAQIDVPPWQGLFPPHTWSPGALVVERQEMWLPYELPAGEYQLVMGLYDPQTWHRLPAYIGTTHLTDDEIDLGTVYLQP